MYTIYKIKADELNNDFIQAIKTQYKDKEIEITVCEVDETEFLFKSEENKKRLLESAENVKTGKNLIEVDITKPE